MRAEKIPIQLWMSGWGSRVESDVDITRSDRFSITDPGNPRKRVSFYFWRKHPLLKPFVLWFRLSTGGALPLSRQNVQWIPGDDSTSHVVITPDPMADCSFSLYFTDPMNKARLRDYLDTFFENE